MWFVAEAVIMAYRQRRWWGRASLLFVMGLFLTVGAFGQAQAQSSDPRGVAPDGILSLQQAVAQALADSPRIGISRADIDAALGTETQAGLRPNPEASVQVENFAGTGLYHGLSASESTLEVSQLLELGGKRAARQASAHANVQTARVDSRAMRLGVTHDVTVAYMDVLAAEARLALSTRVEEAAQDVLAVVKRRVQAARDPQYQESRAKAALSTAIVGRERSEQELTASRDILARFLGEEDLTLRLDRTAFTDASAPYAPNIYQGQLARSPDLARYNYVQSAREADLALARAGRVPDPTISIGVRHFGDTDDAAVLAGISIPIPLFNRNQGEIARAGAELSRAAQERRQVMLELSQQVSRAWSQWNAAWQEIRRLETDALPEAERAYDLALQGFRSGSFQFIDVQDARQAYFDISSALIDARLRLQTAQADMDRLTSRSIEPQSGEPNR